MQSPIDTGNRIAELRKKAGYTQQTLATALGITDKAISKWERGISCPDISLLPKLSVLLDADIEALLSGVADIYSHKWKGILYIPENSFSLETLVFDKPLVYYLLSNFLLVGITDILIITSKENTISSSLNEELRKIGFNINFHIKDIEDLGQCIKVNKDFIKDSDTFIISDVYFVFGASLTRNYQSFMALKEGSIQLYLSDEEKTPFAFISKEQWSSFFDNKIKFETILSNSLKKKISRGSICLPIKTHKQLCDTSAFIKFYQDYHYKPICDLVEISKNRGFFEE